ncbi:site-specific DNA-methyltransferase [Streptomyces sp. NPDC058953]|uniref:site-specific DNA-methyltransferase n=1 Tax=unclassified Streptomyces TaxID=2593676 RepID=UPI0036C29515
MNTSGRLSLSWINKGRSLVSDGTGGYEWVDRDDFRVTETRLLRDAAVVGEVREDARRAEDNLLITGDSGDALRALTRLPEFADVYRGRVKLVYIDPPFNTGQAFEHYDDGLEHSVWLTMMRDRLLLIRELLDESGSVWVHLDDAEMAYCKVLMDEIFGRRNFISTIIWKRRNDPRNTAQYLSGDHDSMLVFAKNIDALTFNKLPRTEAMDSAYTNPDDDARGPWRRGDLAARNYYSKGMYPVLTPGGRRITGPPSGSYWRVSEEELTRLDGEGRIYWGPDGMSRPYLKRYLTEVTQGRIPSSVWHPEEVGFVRNGKEEIRALMGDVFATPKPERLLRQVLTIASSPGDIVLDCFAGSGTTAATAHKLGRRWVTVEREPETADRFVRPRLEKVVDGSDGGGISQSAGWREGGGFRHLEVGPSMYEDVAGRVLLAPWVRGDAFTAAARAQLPGFAPDPEAEAPFAGRKGRQRLAVVDGLVTESTVRSIVGALADDERVLIVAKSYLREAAGLLESLSPGSRLKKAPRDLLDMEGRVLR